MFTGLIEEIGHVAKIQNGARSTRIAINANLVTEELKLGDSISTNGVCLTVVEFSKSHFTADVMPETIKRSNLKSLKLGSAVNLERAVRPFDRLGGHIVSGHIDGVGVMSEIKKDDNAIWFKIEAPKEIMRYIIEKGSVALDGISLTVAWTSLEAFKVSIIPHTLSKTTLQSRKVGDLINIECDAFGKYVERFAIFDSNHKEDNRAEEKSKVDMEFLKINGFL